MLPVRATNTNTKDMEAEKLKQAAKTPSRRRFLAVSAAAAGLALARSQDPHARPGHFTWRGIALGAEAQIQLIHPDEAAARAILGGCVAEIDRLENIFSLYRPDSTLCQLNRLGQVSAPELEFVDLLARARQFHNDTGGAFDITVQPLWNLYSSRREPAPEDLKRSLQLVGFDKVGISSQHVHLGREGMSLTLNGIAQGYITDRVVGLLKHSGYQDILVHLGESFGAGLRADGAPWRAAIEGTPEIAELTDRALATSGSPGGTDSGHLFDPRTGRTPRRYRAVSVSAPTATIADALATAFHVMTQDQVRQTLTLYQQVAVTFIGPSGRPDSFQSN